MSMAYATCVCSQLQLPAYCPLENLDFGEDRLHACQIRLMLLLEWAAVPD